MHGAGPVWWLVLGIVLITVELAAPGLVSLFFGLSALIVALLTWLIPSEPPWLQWLLFSFFSVFFLVTLRRWCRSCFPSKQTRAPGDPDRDIVGKQAVVTQRIEPGRPGKVELRGAQWVAHASETLEPGAQVRVVKLESITLFVEHI